MCETPLAWQRLFCHLSKELVRLWKRKRKKLKKGKNIVDSAKGTQVWKAIFGDLLFGEFKPLSPINSLMRGIAKIMQLHPYNMSVGGKRIIMYTFCLGGLSVFFFALLSCTGAFLMIYYNPDVNKAYANVEDFRYIVPFGVLIRNMHRWTAHLMVMFVSLHMLRVFLTGAYKPPRELNWIVGVILLVLTMLSSFTGYLLPWDQLAYWGVTIGCSMGENAPFLGAKGPFALLESGKRREFYPGRRNCGWAAHIIKVLSFACDSAPSWNSQLNGFPLLAH